MTSGSQNKTELLEERIAHQERIIEELSEQVSNQWKHIENLQSAIRQLNSQLMDLEDSVSPAPANAKPPHW